MPGNSRSGVEAFIDKGFPDSKTFCVQFLYSPEFNLNTLKSLVKRALIIVSATEGAAVQARR